MDTKSSILSTALAEASTSGLGSLTIGNLATLMGMSKSGLFAHFKSKEALQMMVLDLAAENFVLKVVKPAILGNARGIPRIKALADNWIRWGTREMPGGCPMVTASVEFDDQPGKLQAKVKKMQKEWIKTLARMAEIAMDEGHFSKKRDPRQFAFDFYAIMLGYHLYKRLLNDPKSGQYRKHSFNDLIERYR